MNMLFDSLSAFIELFPSLIIIVLIIMSLDGNDYFFAFFIGLIQTILSESQMGSLLIYAFLLATLFIIYSAIMKVLKALNIDGFFYLLILLGVCIVGSEFIINAFSNL